MGKRCEFCNKKVGLLGMVCKCGDLFCVKHISDHNCGFDHKKEFREKFIKENPVITPKKLETF